MTTLIENSNTGSSNIQYAGFTKRLKAFGFDHLFIFAYIVMLLGVGFGITLTAEPLEDISPLITKKHRTPYDWAAGSYVIVIK